MPSAARALVLLLGLVCITVGALVHRADDRCADVVDAAVNLAPEPSDAASRRLADRTIDRCRDFDQALVVAVVLRATDHEDDALRIARGFVRRNPESFAGWLGVARLESDPQRARSAFGRARELNPRGAPRAPRTDRTAP